MHTYLNTSVSLFILVGLLSCKRDKPSNVISIGQVETIHSRILDEDRTVWVHIPEDNPPDSVKYPVLYLMDGSANFKSVVGLMHHLSTAQGNMICPKMIIVAILNTQRTRDLSTTEMKSWDEKTGGGEAFTKFIAEELIPFIEQNYPATNQRTLVGHSLGGLMVINTLVKHGDLFEKYLAIDPSLWWDDQRSLHEYQHALARSNFKGRSLFIGIANTINMDTLVALQDTTQSTAHFRAINSFLATLRQSKTNGLDWQAKYYPDEHHGTVPLINEYDGFHFLYRKIPIKMEMGELKPFEGRYTAQFRAGEDLFLDIVAKEDFLSVTESWRKVEMTFRPVGKNEFYNSREKFSLQFRTNSNGAPFELVAFGRDVWKKVE